MKGGESVKGEYDGESILLGGGGFLVRELGVDMASVRSLGFGGFR
jgi:hypothetical protein